jgi:signal peptidase I
MAPADLKSALAFEVLDNFREARLPVTGTSMLPTLRPGDILELHCCHPDHICSGDIVVFRHRDHLVSHRVVGNHKGFLVTRGDRLRRPDLPIATTDVLACVTAIHRGPLRLNPKLTTVNRRVAWALSRSDLLTRLALHFHL